MQPAPGSSTVRPQCYSLSHHAAQIYKWSCSRTSETNVSGVQLQNLCRCFHSDHTSTTEDLLPHPGIDASEAVLPLLLLLLLVVLGVVWKKDIKLSCPHNKQNHGTCQQDQFVIPGVVEERAFFDPSDQILVEGLVVEGVSLVNKVKKNSILSETLCPVRHESRDSRT